MQNSHEKARQTWILVLASLASFMVSLDALVVVTALTTIHRDLGVSIEALEWTLNAYTLSFAVLIIPHTLKVTTLGRLAAGDAVNLEVDLMARYVARLMDRS